MAASRAFDDDRVLEVLDRAPVLYSAVDSGRGMHTTPTAFSWSGGAFWFVAPRRSVKVRSLRARPRVGLLLRSREYDLVATGRASMVDPLDGRGVANLDRLVDFPFFAAGYLGRNSKHIAGILRDAELTPNLVLDRTAVRIRPRRLALLRGNRVLASWGDWTSLDLVGDHPPAPLEVDASALPVAVRALVREAGPGCLGWPSVHGPTALPVHWPGSGGVPETSAELMALVGAYPTGRAALAVSTGGFRLASKRGVMIRGDGEATAEGHRALIGLAARRITYWQGEHSATLDLLPAA